MYAFTLNMVIATIWLLLSRQPTVPDFVLGFALGYAVIAAFRSLLPDGVMYIRRSIAFFRFLALFLKAFVLANFSVAATVLFRSRHDLQPDFLAYDVAGLRRGEILLLSYCITLTPGTMTIRVADDFQHLVIHALDAAEPDAIRRQIDRELKEPILAFTR